jgi:hypothetical protein
MIAGWPEEGPPLNSPALAHPCRFQHVRFLKIIQKANLDESANAVIRALEENNELISIFVRSVQTARRNSEFASR